MGIVEINTELNAIGIFAQLFFYGNEANEALSTQIAMDINSFWNVSNGYVDYNNRRYRFFLNAVGNYAPELTAQQIIENTDARKNYIRIEEYCKLDVSFVDGLNSNTGYFKLANILNNSTTAAHEFGHTLGLDHPDVLDVRGEGTPGIMYPRGTLVDPHYQYDPSANAGAIGGTVNPIHRRVLQHDIDNLHIEKLKFDSEGRAVIGNFTNIWHEAHVAP
jgi:hypothetical protein